MAEKTSSMASEKDSMTFAVSLYFRTCQNTQHVVAACTFLYKLFCAPPLSALRSLLPPKAAIPRRHTRLAASSIQGHLHQLETGLPIRSNSSSLRTFPACLVPIWNGLPKSLLQDAPTAKKMQSFKVGVHKYLLRKNWLGQTDSL